MSALWKRDSGGLGTSGGARTTETYILGVGASGALLAGAGVALISLVGLVSFDVWPSSPSVVGSPEQAQLNLGGEDGQATADPSLTEVPGLIVAAPPGTADSPASNGGGADDNPQNQPPKATRPGSQPPAGTAPTAPTAPGSGGGDTGSPDNPGAVINPPAPSGSGGGTTDPSRQSQGPPAHSNAGGNGNGRGKSGSKTRSSDSPSSLSEVTQSIPGIPWSGAPASTGNGNGNGKGHGNGHGNGK